MITLTIILNQHGDGCTINPSYTDTEPTEREKYVATEIMNAISAHMRTMGARATTTSELQEKLDTQGQG